MPISCGEGCQSRVQIRSFCPRRPFISLSRVQIVGFCPRRLIHVCKITPFALVVLYGCCPELRQEPAKLRVLRNSPRAMPLFGLPIIVMSARYTSRKQGKLQRACACKCHVVHGCRSGSFALVIPLLHCHGCRSRVFAHVGFHVCCPELRQGPAQLRVLRNSPRAMPLSGYELVRPELTCKESVLMCFH